MAIDSNYQNGDAAMTMLQPKRLGSGEFGSSSQLGFINKVRTMPMAFTERFEAHVKFPQALDLEMPGQSTTDIGLASNECALLCEEVQIPGMVLSNKEQQYGNWVFYRNTNMGFLGNEINITFYSDVDWNLRYVFERWMSHCVNATSKQVRFPDDQFGEILINQLDKEGNIRGQWQLMEATPKVLNLVPLSMGAVSIARTTLIVSSAYWKSRAIDVDLNKTI
tara:strand:- start:5877 stop:6542 length:666 start_codon:yes stop_codon:yes gene_type:complete